MIKKWLIDKCRELNYHHMVAKIFSVNEASIAYNRKLGYELVGTQREIGFVDGAWQDVTIMQLILD
jgi:phosphinothricin acetyltransferase